VDHGDRQILTFPARKEHDRMPAPSRTHANSRAKGKRPQLCKISQKDWRVYGLVIAHSPHDNLRLDSAYAGHWGPRPWWVAAYRQPLWSTIITRFFWWYWKGL